MHSVSSFGKLLSLFWLQYSDKLVLKINGFLFSPLSTCVYLYLLVLCMYLLFDTYITFRPTNKSLWLTFLIAFALFLSLFSHALNVQEISKFHIWLMFLIT